MPRKLPRLDVTLGKQVTAALSLVSRLEVARISSNRDETNKISLMDVEFAYEIAYLRVFLAWEVFLEEALLRFMCGYKYANGQEPLRHGVNYFRRIADAEAYIRGSNRYVLWHNPDTVINRASEFFNNSNYEQVIASDQQRLKHLANIRHRIAHAQKDAAYKFNITTMAISGKRYRASRPGRFLRDWQYGSNPPRRWIGAIFRDLEALAQQICL